MVWQLVLGEIWAHKQELLGLDPRRGGLVEPPPGASAVAVAAVERKLKAPLPPSYRAFLLAHDGLPELYQGASLLNTYHLAAGTYVELAQMVLGFNEPPRSRRPAAPPPPSIVPFAIDTHAETIFAWDLDARSQDGECEVLVYIGEIADRVESFTAALELVLLMLSSELEEAKRELGYVPVESAVMTSASRRRSVRGDLELMPVTRREGAVDRVIAA